MRIGKGSVNSSNRVRGFDHPSNPRLGKLMLKNYTILIARSQSVGNGVFGAAVFPSLVTHNLFPFRWNSHEDADYVLKF